jgi:hypothetical protein
MLIVTVLLGYTVYKYVPDLSTFFTSNYKNNGVVNGNQLNYVLEENKLLKNNIFNSINKPITGQINGLAEFNKE